MNTNGSPGAKYSYSQFFCKLYQKIATQKLTITGPAITIYHNPNSEPLEFEIEFAVPIKEVITGTRDFQNGLCVKSTLNGPYASITSIYARQQEWAEANGYTFTKSPFELYITEPNANNTPDDYITEIYYPVIGSRNLEPADQRSVAVRTLKSKYCPK